MFTNTKVLIYGCYAQRMRILYFLLFLTFITTSCTHYLSEEESDYMPYKAGDLLIFQSLSDGSIDTISISHVDRFVPDGEQIYFNELIVAYHKNNNTFIQISAGYGKNNEAYLEIRGFEGDKQYLKDIDQKSILSLTTPFSKFEDVVILEGRKGEYKTPKTIRIYWSRSSGIIKYENSDGEVLELIDLQQTD